jgi:NhaP-type Na+/H+ or K+/H+ antiporter
MLSLVASERFQPWTIAGEVALGIVIGVTVPWALITLGRTLYFSAHANYRPLNAFAIGLLILTISRKTGANEFLAAFAGGMTVASIGPEAREAFHRFGALVSPRFLAEISMSGYLFAFLAIVAVRPVALSISLLGSSLDWRERAIAAWFGPKGFASVVFGLLILERSKVAKVDFGLADQLFHLIALCIAGSILAHSSTDVIAARWLARDRQEEPAPRAD